MPGCTLLMALTMLGAAGGCAASTGHGNRRCSGRNSACRSGSRRPSRVRRWTIGFEAVHADSRCPKGEACVWEGDAIVLITVRSAAGRWKNANSHVVEGAGHCRL